MSPIIPLSIGAAILMRPKRAKRRGRSHARPSQRTLSAGVPRLDNTYFLAVIVGGPGNPEGQEQHVVRVISVDNNVGPKSARDVLVELVPQEGVPKANWGKRFIVRTFTDFPNLLPSC